MDPTRSYNRPMRVLTTLAGLTAVYVLFAEITKKLFYRRLTW